MIVQLFSCKIKSQLNQLKVKAYVETNSIIFPPHVLQPTSFKIERSNDCSFVKHNELEENITYLVMFFFQNKT